MQELNKEQLKAVKTTEGYVEVISGAGTGKTRIITNRYVYLVNEMGISNGNILCVTFTNNAAEEMKNRINKMIKDKDIGYICTFHSLAVKGLREDIHCIGIVPNFVIMDTEDQNLLLKRIYKKLGISNKIYHYKDMKEFIAKTKERQELITNSNSKIDYINFLGGTKNENVLPDESIENKFFNEYLKEQRKNSMLDFNDLINIFLYILIKYEDKRNKWQQRFQYIMCDEFNDIDRKQYLILKILSQYHKNLLIVGDPDQSIYGWRGSDVNYILGFSKEFKNAQNIIVNTNYRSIPNILQVANSLIKHNKNRIEKDLIPFRSGDRKVVYHSLKDSQEEAKWVVNKIERLIKEGEYPNNIAVLYRNNRLSRSVEEQLLEKDIKYCVYNGIDFYSRKEIKDIISYLRFLIYEDDLDFQRIVNVPKRGIGNKKLEILFEYAEKNNCTLYQALKDNIECKDLKKAGKEFVKLIEDLKEKSNKVNVSDLVSELLKITGYEAGLKEQNEEDRIENIEELKHSILEFEKQDEEKKLKDYLDKIALYTNNDRKTKDKAVKLMTIHNSKGLEFDNVFIIGINDGILPSEKIKIPEGIEEERRLFYVAITRAKDRLYLTDTKTSYSDMETNCSRFLLELDKKYIEFEDEDSKDRISQERKNNIVQDKNVPEMLLNVGDIVLHSVFGRGIIKQVNIENKTYSIKFNNTDTIRNISYHIRLDKIEEDKVVK